LDGLNEMLENEIILVQLLCENFAEKHYLVPGLKTVEKFSVQHEVYKLIPIILQIERQISQPHHMVA